MIRRGSMPLEIPALLAAAALCAWISNALAGPTRRLSWFPEQVTAQKPIVPPLPAPATAPPVEPKVTAHSGLSAELRKAPKKVTEPKPAAPSPDWDPAALLARFPPLQAQPYAPLTSEETQWLHTHGALFLDARRSDVYAKGHIAGALCLPVWEDGLPDKIAALKADPLLPLVVYCAGGDCEDSHLLGQKLWLAGYRNVRVYTDGYPDWSSRAWPVTLGAKP